MTSKEDLRILEEWLEVKRLELDSRDCKKLLSQSEVLKLWIALQMSTAKPQDYEHLEMLLQHFKLKVQAGEEKFKSCNNLAKKL